MIADKVNAQFITCKALSRGSVDDHKPVSGRTTAVAYGTSLELLGSPRAGYEPTLAVNLHLILARSYRHKLVTLPGVCD
jgi:hypothetical protein